MAFRSRPERTATASPPAGQPCGSLARVLARTFREDKPEILDLGRLCGESAVYFAGRGSRVHIEPFEPPPPIPPRKPGEPPRWVTDPAAKPDDLVILRGRSFTFRKPLSYADLEAEQTTPMTQFLDKGSPYTGFRVVVELPE